MQIVESDDVAPFGVFELNLLSFRFALTPKLPVVIGLPIRFTAGMGTKRWVVLHSR